MKRAKKTRAYNDMRNRILVITRKTVPYVMSLRPLAESVLSCIVMQQLDFWFSRYPKGFYKFLEPAEHPQYRRGQSWLEEIGFSIAEFRTAFDRIGIRYTSKTAFYAEEDPFKGKFYASYFDRNLRLTIYYRNHRVVDAALDRMQRENPEDWFPAEDFDCSAPEPEPALQARIGSPVSQGKVRSTSSRRSPKFVAAASSAPVQASPRDAESAFPRDAESAFPRDAESAFPRDAESASPRDAESASSRDVTSTGGEMQNQHISYIDTKNTYIDYYYRAQEAPVDNSTPVGGSSSEIQRIEPPHQPPTMRAPVRTTEGDATRGSAPKSAHPDPHSGAGENAPPARGAPAAAPPAMSPEPPLIFPTSMEPAVVAALGDVLAHCPSAQRQAVLDEVVAAQGKGKVHTGPVNFARGLVARANAGGFLPALGVEVRSRRESEARRIEREQVVATSAPPDMRPVGSYSDEELAKMPPNLRSKMTKLRDDARGALSPS